MTASDAGTQQGGHTHAFVEQLQRLAEREDRAALAELRRGLGRAPGEAVGMYRYVVPFVPLDAPPWEERAYYLIASLFALHQGSWNHDEAHRDSRNFGASFRRLADQSGSESIEKRFVALLNAEPAELPNHLRQGVRLLKAHDVPVDWLQLLRDVRGWGHPEGRVRRNWARAYWRATPMVETAGTGEASEAAKLEG